MCSAITKKRDAIVVSRIYQSKYEKAGDYIIELKQTVHSTVVYPPKSVTKQVLDNPFNVEQAKAKAFTRSKTYVVFLTTDQELSIEEAQNIIDKYPNSVIYKILSNHPILTSNQQLVYDFMEDESEKEQYLEQIANKQFVNRKGNVIFDGNGKPQYLATYLSLDPKEDKDLRTKDRNDYFSTPFVQSCIEITSFNKGKVVL